MTISTLNESQCKAARVTLVLETGELPIIVWLVIWGTRLRPSGAPAATAAGG